MAWAQPVAFWLTGGQAGKFAEALSLLARRQGEIVMADRGYDSNAIVAAFKSIGAEVVIPSRICRKLQRPQNRTLSKLRNCIERCFNWLKHFRHLATYYCKCRLAFQATVASPLHGYTWSVMSIPPGSEHRPEYKGAGPQPRPGSFSLPNETYQRLVRSA